MLSCHMLQTTNLLGISTEKRRNIIYVRRHVQKESVKVAPPTCVGTCATVRFARMSAFPECNVGEWGGSSRK